MTTEADLERIINHDDWTKAARARALIELGCDRTDVVELLGVTYSQAHSAWKEIHGKPDPRKAARSTNSRRAGQGGADDQLQPGASGSRHGSRLNLRPAQTRYITQDGHVIYRDPDGKYCTSCDHEITFSLRYLGFIHTNSKSEPTKLEDIYQ